MPVESAGNSQRETAFSLKNTLWTERMERSGGRIVMIQSYVLLGILGLHSIEDIRDKKITISVSLLAGIVGVLLHLLFQKESIYSMLLGMAAGAGILLLSLCSQGRLGAGDGIVFMMTGLYLGAAGNLILMFLSFALAGIWGISMLCLGRIGKNDRIPLIPFLFVSYVGMCLGGGM